MPRPAPPRPAAVLLCPAALRERYALFQTVISGDVPIELERQFLARHNHADLQARAALPRALPALHALYALHALRALPPLRFASPASASALLRRLRSPCCRLHSLSVCLFRLGVPWWAPVPCRG